MSTLSANMPDIELTQAPDRVGDIGRWLIFFAGLAILVCALILPAQVDLRQTQIQRDLALHIEEAHKAKNARYAQFLGAIEQPDESTVQLLAMSQLGMIRENREALIIEGQPADPQLFEFLEPVPKPFVSSVRPLTRLERLTVGQHSRLWVVLIGAVAVMYGLLPPAKSCVD